MIDTTIKEWFSIIETDWDIWKEAIENADDLNLIREATEKLQAHIDPPDQALNQELRGAYMDVLTAIRYAESGVLALSRAFLLSAATHVDRAGQLMA